MQSKLARSPTLKGFMVGLCLSACCCCVAGQPSLLEMIAKMSPPCNKPSDRICINFKRNTTKTWERLECISAFWLCDGYKDCHEGQDEDETICKRSKKDKRYRFIFYAGKGLFSDSELAINFTFFLHTSQMSKAKTASGDICQKNW